MIFFINNCIFSAWEYSWRFLYDADAIIMNGHFIASIYRWDWQTWNHQCLVYLLYCITSKDLENAKEEYDPYLHLKFSSI